MTKNQWFRNNDVFKLQANATNPLDTLPQGVYSIEFNDREGFYLTKLQDKFQMPAKLYNVCDTFINRVITTYTNSDSNLGVLMSGLKGAGKSQSAKIICNTLKLPTIIVKNMGPLTGAMFDWISTFNFPCVYLFDEFEKNFGADDSTASIVLPFLDGVYKNESKKLFLLTVNSTRVNKNLISRPSRIRYTKEFSNLNTESIKEFLMDNLKDTSLIPQVLSFINTFTIISIDILNALTQEINMYGFEYVVENKDELNITIEKIRYNCNYKHFDTGSMEEVHKYVRFMNLEAVNPKEASRRSDDEKDEFYGLSYRWYSRLIEVDKHFQDIEKGDKVNYSEYDDDTLYVTEIDRESNIIYGINPSNPNYIYALQFKNEVKLSSLLDLTL